MSTTAFVSLSTVCQYLTMYRLFVLCHYFHYCLLQIFHCLSVPHTIPTVVSLSLVPLLPSTVCPLSVCNSHCTDCCVSVTRSAIAFYSLSTVCQYLTLYRKLSPYHCVHYCLLQSVHCLSVPHTVLTVGSLSLCPLLSSTVCPLSVSTSNCTDCWVSVTMSTTVFYSLSIVCQYLTMYRLLGLCHYVFYCLLQSVHCLSVPYTVPTLLSLWLCPLLPSTVCPLSVSTSYCTFCWVFATMSITVFYSLSIVSIPHCTACWVSVTMSNTVIYSLSTLWEGAPSGGDGKLWEGAPSGGDGKLGIGIIKSCDNSKWNPEATYAVHKFTTLLSFKSLWQHNITMSVDRNRNFLQYLVEIQTVLCQSIRQ